MGLDLTVHHGLGPLDLGLRGGLVRRGGLLQRHLGVHQSGHGLLTHQVYHLAVDGVVQNVVLHFL